MNNCRIVVITGKLCSGKSDLAKLLESEFDFRRIEYADDTLEQIDSSKNTVIDSLASILQVNAFRKVFGSNLTHVHLYASEETLLDRFQSLKDTLEGGSYSDFDTLSDVDEIDCLKSDADVRIYTTRCDARDTLVRVAASLKLYAPPDTRCVDVLVGGQYGSEGKGNIVAFLAGEYDVMVRVGGPNAGHTVTSPAGMYTYHHLPSGCRDVKAVLLLGAGMTIKVSGLLKEIADCHIPPERLFIDPQAMIIEDKDLELEREKLVSSIASTGSGSGAAAARRILNRYDVTVKLAKDVPELKPYIASTVDKLEEAYRKRQSILLEGTQGSGLSIFHGTYPYVTSRDTNVAGCLSEAGISPSRVRKVMMVVRPMPIRVGDPDGDEGKTSGPLKHQTTFEKIAELSGLDPTALKAAEKTSTTNRSRRVGWFEWEQFRKACSLNAPTDIVLTFADYLTESNKNARRFEQLNTDTIKFIEELERVSKAPVSLINTRFQRGPDENSDLRSVIDRRTWSARTTSSRNKWTKND